MPGGCYDSIACNTDLNADFEDSSMCVYPPLITADDKNWIDTDINALHNSGIIPDFFTLSNGTDYNFNADNVYSCTCDDINFGPGDYSQTLVNDKGAFCMGGLGPKMCNGEHCAEFEEWYKEAPRGTYANINPMLPLTTQNRHYTGNQSMFEKRIRNRGAAGSVKIPLYCKFAESPISDQGSTGFDSPTEAQAEMDRYIIFRTKSLSTSKAQINTMGGVKSGADSSPIGPFWNKIKFPEISGNSKIENGIEYQQYAYLEFDLEDTFGEFGSGTEDFDIEYTCYQWWGRVYKDSLSDIVPVGDRGEYHWPRKGSAEENIDIRSGNNGNVDWDDGDPINYHMTDNLYHSGEYSTVNVKVKTTNSSFTDSLINSNFGVPDVDVSINPSLNTSYDPYSGIDLRKDFIIDKKCSHIELKRTGANGDGLWYKSANYPYDTNTYTCDTVPTEWGNVTANQIKVKCKDGRSILLARTKDFDSVTTITSNDYIYFNGHSACNSEAYNNDLYWMSDQDKRPTLGLITLEKDNRTINNLDFAIPDSPDGVFDQMEIGNLTKNGEAQIVESYNDKAYTISKVMGCAFPHLKAFIPEFDIMSDSNVSYRKIRWYDVNVEGGDNGNNICLDPHVSEGTDCGSVSLKWEEETEQDNSASDEDNTFTYEDFKIEGKSMTCQYQNPETNRVDSTTQIQNVMGTFRKHDSITKMMPKSNEDPDSLPPAPPVDRSYLGYGWSMIAGSSFYCDCVGTERDLIGIGLIAQPDDFSADADLYVGDTSANEYVSDLYLYSGGPKHNQTHWPLKVFDDEEEDNPDEIDMEMYREHNKKGRNKMFLPPPCNDGNYYDPLYQCKATNYYSYDINEPRPKGEANVFKPAGDWGRAIFLASKNWNTSRKNRYYQNTSSPYPTEERPSSVGWESGNMGSVKNDEVSKFVKSNECLSYNKCLTMSASRAYWDSDDRGDRRNEMYTQLAHYNYTYVSSPTGEPSEGLQPYSQITVSFMMKTTAAENSDANNNGPENIKRDILIPTNFTGSMPMIEVGHDTAWPLNLKYPNYYNPTAGGGITYNSFGWESYPGSTSTNLLGTVGRFQNTGLNKWEKMKYTFQLGENQHENQDILSIKKIFTTWSWCNKAYGEVFLDNFEIKPSADFQPDVDVRKKISDSNYGKASLTEYYDEELQAEEYVDTTAPLEAQFYFYPRHPYNELFDLDYSNINPRLIQNDIIYEDFNLGHFYLYDVDWGDESQNDFIGEPKKINNTTAVYHTYKKSGIFKVTGTMLRTKHILDEKGKKKKLTDATSQIGVISHKNFILTININQGRDEDFTFFYDDDGFSFLPYKNTTPVIGGISKESSYYKNIKRQLGFIVSGSSNIKVKSLFKNNSDKLQTELALVKMDQNKDIVAELEILPAFQEKRYNDEGTLIYNGLTPIIQELGTAIGDVDLTNIRYFNKPKSMAEMLGFPCSKAEEESIINLISNNDFNTSGSNDLWSLQKACPSAQQDLPIIENGYAYIKTTNGSQWSSVGKIEELNNINTVAGVEYTLTIKYKLLGNESDGNGASVGFYIPAEENGGSTWGGLRNFDLPYNNSPTTISYTFIAQHDDELIRIRIEYGTCYDVGGNVINCSGGDGCKGTNTGEIYSIEKELFIYQTMLQTGNQFTEFINFNNPIMVGECLEYDHDNPQKANHWNNIIPQDYSIFNRDGIFTRAFWPQYNTYEFETESGNELVYDSAVSDGPINELSMISFPKVPFNSYYNAGRLIGMLETTIYLENINSFPYSFEISKGGYFENQDAGMDFSENSGFILYIDPSDVNDGAGWKVGSNFIKKNIKHANYYEDNQMITDNVPYIASGGHNYKRLRISIANSFSSNKFSIKDFVIISRKINTTSNFTYNGKNEYNKKYYYPVLPGYDKFGKYQEDDLPPNQIPFPQEAPITNENYTNEFLQFNIFSDKKENNVFNDSTGNQNYGFAFSDYSPQFDDDTFTPKKIKNTKALEIKKNNGAY